VRVESLGCSSWAIKPFASYSNTTELLRAVSRERPLLLAIDDVHDADAQLLGWLRGANAFRGTRVLAGVTYCPSAATGWARSTLELIGKQARSIELAAFDSRTTGAVLARSWGGTPDEATVQRIQAFTRGNPKLVMENALQQDAWAERNPANILHSAAPGAVDAAMANKLAALSADARALLPVALAVGQTFSAGLLLKVSRLSRQAAMAALSELEAAGIVGRSGADRYRFVKGFARGLRQQLSSAERAVIHAHIAANLEAGGRQDSAIAAGDIALHLLASSDPDAIGRALELAQLSAEHSMRSGDYHAAVIMYSMALKAAELSGACHDSLRCDLLIDLAKSQAATDDLAGAHESLHRAVAIAERLGDWTRLAEIALAAPLLDWPPPGAPNGLVTVLAEKLLSDPPDSQALRLALVMARLAAEVIHVPGQRERASQLAAKACAFSPELENDQRVGLTLACLRDRILSDPESIQQRLANSAQIIRIARRDGDWAALFKGEWARQVSLFQLGTLDGADAGQQALEHVANLAGPKYRARALAFKATLAVFEGRFAEGEELLETSRSVARGCGVADQTAQLWPALIMPLDEQERLTELEVFAAGSGGRSAFLKWMWSLLALKLGRTSEARFHLSHLGAAGFRELRSSATLVAEAAALAEVCTELGDLPNYAAILYEILLPYAERNAACDIAAAFGAVARYLGKLALNLGRLDQAIEHFRNALHLNSRMGARPWAAYTSRDLALALLTRGLEQDRPAAVELLLNAHAEATSMGMKRLAKSTAADLERVQAILPSASVGASANVAWLVPNFTAAFNVDSLPAAQDAATQPPARSAGYGAPRGRAFFRLEGSQWEIAYAGKVIRLRRLKGLTLIAYLLSRPNQEIHALELANFAGLAEGGNVAVGVDHAASADLGPVLDPRAKQAYRDRIRELREELEEAQSFNDFERVGKLEEELCVVTRELARALGLGGRDRRTGSYTERARLRVTSAIRWATAKISKQHAPLGRFLTQTIRTGTSCSYVPGPGGAPEWDVRV